VPVVWPDHHHESQFAKKLRQDTVPEQANMIGRHAQALLRHAYLLVDALQFAGEDESDRTQHAVLCLRAKLLRQLLPLWLKMEVRCCTIKCVYDGANPGSTADA